MGRQEEFIRIERLIARWAAEIRLHNAFDFFDINRLGEDIAKDLLNIIYGYELVNLNETQKNYPGIDLADESKKIYFQVTSRSDVKKIKDTLTTVTGKESAIAPTGIRFFILKDSIHRYQPAKLEEFRELCPGFEPGEHIVTLVDLLGEIRLLYTADPGRFRQVREFLEREFSDGTHRPGDDKKSGKKAFTRTAAECPFMGLENFKEEDHRFYFGREGDVDELLERLETQRFLAVLGPSGSGKSSVVQAG
ncbi:MAG: ATP-binding protein [bacterium]|nr:ATP-binding protein [bacterium]